MNRPRASQPSEPTDSADPRLRLHRGARLVSCADLPDAERARLGAASCDYVLTHTASRSSAKLIDAQTGLLVSQLAMGESVATAIDTVADRLGMGVEQLVDGALTAIASLVRDEYLVLEESADDVFPRPGEFIDGFSVVKSLRTVTDTEVYLVRYEQGGYAILKIAPLGMPRATRALTNEGALLTSLPVGIAPRLLSSGHCSRGAFLLMEYITGPTLTAHCDRASVTERLRSCALVLDMYARLHCAGVLHMDVHPGNILIASGCLPRLIDFAESRYVDAPWKGRRMAIASYLDPEYAAARRRGQLGPRPTTLSEQYSMAATIYRAIAGRSHLELPSSREELYAAIENGVMRAFESTTPQLTAVERVLARALDPSPESRFESTAAFSRAFSAALSTAIAISPTETTASAGSISLHADSARSHEDAATYLRETFVASPGYGQHVESCLEPRSSLNFGAAGVALALLRASEVVGSSALLAAADVWAERGLETRSAANAFYSQKLGVSERQVGRSGTFHSPVGVWLVRALVSASMHDVTTVERSVEGLFSALLNCDEKYDVTFGAAGRVIALVELRAAISLLPVATAYRGRLEAQLSVELARLERIANHEIGRGAGPKLLGFAHGWAGVLYALLLGTSALGEAIPARVVERLHELESCAIFHGGRRVVPSRLASRVPDDGRHLLLSWCNGAAGFATLWAESYRRTGDERFLGYMTDAATQIMTSDSEIASLCCGRAGHSIALATMARVARNPAWSLAAKTFAEDAWRQTGPSMHEYSLYKGRVGVALAVILSNSQCAAMPLAQSGF